MRIVNVEFNGADANDVQLKTKAFFLDLLNQMATLPDITLVEPTGTKTYYTLDMGGISRVYIKFTLGSNLMISMSINASFGTGVYGLEKTIIVASENGVYKANVNIGYMSDGVGFFIIDSLAGGNTWGRSGGIVAYSGSPDVLFTFFQHIGSSTNNALLYATKLLQQNPTESFTIANHISQPDISVVYAKPLYLGKRYSNEIYNLKSSHIRNFTTLEFPTLYTITDIGIGKFLRVTTNAYIKVVD